MPRGEIIRWSLFSVLLVVTGALWARFAFCMWILRWVHLPAGDLYGYAQEANLYGSLGLILGAATLLLLIINIRYHIRSSRQPRS
jgi:uncharacterized membrane protein